MNVSMADSIISRGGNSEYIQTINCYWIMWRGTRLNFWGYSILSVGVVYAAVTYMK